MAMVEGRGNVAPAPVRIRLSARELRDLIDESRRRSKFRSYASRQDAWGRGLTRGATVSGSGSIPPSVVPILSGMAGEYALAILLNRRLGRKVVELDTVLRPGGDDGSDLQPLGYRIQVKTKTKPLGKNLVRRTDKRRGVARILPLDADAYVFCLWVPQSPLVVEVLGWIDKREMRRCSLRRSPIKRATHFNLVIPSEDLTPVNRLVNELQIRMEQE